MSSRRGPRSPRASAPEKTTAETQAKVNERSKEQRDSHSSDGKRQPTGAAKDNYGENNGQTKKRMEKSGSQDKPATSKSDKTAAPQSRQTQKDFNRDRDETSKTSEDLRAPESRARKSAHNTDHLCDTQARKKDTQESVRKKTTDQRKFESERKPHKDDVQESAKSRHSKKQKNPERCESQDKSATNPAPQRAHSKRQSQQQNDHSNRNGDDGSPELSSSTRQGKRSAKPHNSDHTNSADVAQKPCVTLVNDKLEAVLHATLDKLKIKKIERSNASSRVNEMTEKVISHLKRKMSWCADIESLKTGSYYENVKICEPDEFDVMLTIPVERVDIKKFNDSGAFYSVALKRHNKHPLDRFLNDDMTIRASEMLNEFRDGVKEAVESLSYKIDVQRKKQKCPAVTLQITENGNPISIDFVLGLKVHGSWPDYTYDGFKIESWLGTKVKTDLKRRPYYMVPKYEGKGNAEHDGVVAKDVWRISFSHVEKDIMKRHGHSKTCCESKGQKCCRKQCLKLLKYLLSRLKEKYPEKMSKFCSYHAKTTLFHACARKVEDSEWAYGKLANCFQELLGNFVESLRKQDLRNFFVPSQNLLHQDHVPKSNCEFLAKQIELEQNNTFPIFQ